MPQNQKIALEVKKKNDGQLNLQFLYTENKILTNL